MFHRVVHVVKFVAERLICNGGWSNHADLIGKTPARMTHYGQGKLF